MSVCEMYENALNAVKCLKWKEKRNTFAFKPNVRTVVK